MNAKEFVYSRKGEFWCYNQAEVIDVLQQYEVMKNKELDSAILKRDVTLKRNGRLLEEMSVLEEDLDIMENDLFDEQQRNNKLIQELDFFKNNIEVWKDSHDKWVNRAKDAEDMLEAVSNERYRYLKERDEALRKLEYFGHIQDFKEERDKWYKNYCSVVECNHKLNAEVMELEDRVAKASVILGC